MTSIKKLPQTVRKVKVRSDGVKQSYWCGRKPKALKKHPGWKNKSFRNLRKAGWKGGKFTDSDHDGKANTFDCKPLDATRQDNEETPIISLNDFRKKIKNLNKGYVVKTHVTSFQDLGGNSRRFLEVYQKPPEGREKWVYGGSNAFSSEHLERHKEVFDLIRKYKGLIRDKDGGKVL